MAEVHRWFDTCLVLRDLWQDDLGHLCRAAAIEDGAVGRRLWLRIFDGPGVPQSAVVAAIDDARRLAEGFTDPQLPPQPLFLIDSGVPGLAWEASVGQPLNRILARARDEALPLQPDNALLIVAKIARCLATTERIGIDGHALHHGFLHPGLVLLSDDGEAEVTGFGLGAALIGAESDPHVLPGAVAYMAPEVLGGKGSSTACDVYSLGAILFHLLTGTALPTAVAEREAAVEAARLAWDGEPIPDDIRQLLSHSLASTADDRMPSATQLCPKIENLVYGGAYSPTTFNLALFMDRLFRAEFEADELARSEEDSIDVGSLLPADPEPEPTAPEPETVQPRPTAVPPDRPSRSRRVLWVVVVTIIGMGAVGAGLWLGRGALAPAGPAPTPTPSAAEIEARRQAQEDRLRSMTQAMVQEMMAEKETEIRQELMARQKRIEELQWRLQQSERRAVSSAAAAADEAATQQALKAEIQAEEQAQRAQEEALETTADDSETPDTWPVAVDDAGGASAAAATSRGEATPGAVDRTPTVAVVVERPFPEPTAPRPTVVRAVSPGDFIEPDAVDSDPVVIKSQPLTWPHTALRSGVQGVVVVRVTVNPTGGVDEVEVLRVDDDAHGIPEAAVEAATGYRFKPGFKDGVPITTYAFITWRYDFSRQ